MSIFNPETYIMIAYITGAVVGYAIGFFTARRMYRSPNWPRA